MKKGIKVVLVQAPFWTVQSPPFSLATLSAFLREKKYNVSVFDFNINFYKKNKFYYIIWKHLASVYQITWNKFLYKLNIFLNDKIFDRWVNEIIKTDAQIIGFSVYSSGSLFTQILAQKIKEKARDKIIIFGGSNCRLHGHVYINLDYVDFVCVGEGENSLAEILYDLEHGTMKKSYKGMLSKFNGKIVDGGESELIQLEKLPTPDYNDFNLSDYVKLYLSISSSRGCMYRCTYCGDMVNIFGNCFRFKSAKKVFSELKYLRDNYNVKRFAFADLMINGNIKELDRLCDLIIKNNLDILWTGFIRFRKEMNFKLFKKMKKAGCGRLFYGVETGSQNVLNAMNRRYKVEEGENILRLTNNAGIEVGATFMVGFPTESFKDFVQTLKFVSRNNNYFYFINHLICRLSPGSNIDINPEDYGVISRKMWTWRTSRLLSRKMWTWRTSRLDIWKRIFRYVVFTLWVKLVIIKDLLYIKK